MNYDVLSARGGYSNCSGRKLKGQIGKAYREGL